MVQFLNGGSKTEPFKIRILKHSEFECIQDLNGRYSSSDCIFLQVFFFSTSGSEVTLGSNLHVTDLDLNDTVQLKVIIIFSQLYLR